MLLYYLELILSKVIFLIPETRYTAGVTTQKTPGSGAKKRKKSAALLSAWNNVNGPQGKMGVREAMESRRILTIGKRRIDGKWHPKKTGLHGKK